MYSHALSQGLRGAELDHRHSSDAIAVSIPRYFDHTSSVHVHVHEHEHEHEHAHEHMQVYVLHVCVYMHYVCCVCVYMYTVCMCAEIHRNTVRIQKKCM